MGYIKDVVASKKRYIAVRWTICFITSVMIFSLVSTKASLSLAIVAMTDPDYATSILQVDNITYSTAFNESNPKMTIEPDVQRIPGNRHYINWTQSTNDKLLEASFIGAILSPIPSGRISEKFGARIVAFIMALTAGFTMLLFPIAAEWTFQAAFAIRVIHGICVGCCMPCAHILVSHWAVKYEKTLFASLMTSGSLLANVITLPIVGFLCSSSFLGGWPAVFYVFGIIQLLAAFVWFFFVHDDPESHPFISEAEKKLIIENRSSSSKDSSLSIPWRDVLTSAPIWALILSNFAWGWLESIISSLIPSFLDTILNLPIEQNGLLSALPYIVSIFTSNLFSWISDKLRSQGKYSTSALRKFFADIGFIGSSLALVGATYVGTRTGLIVTFITASKAIGVAQVAGCYVMHLDISPTYAGSIVGLMETAQNLSSVLMNQMAAAIVGDMPTLESWSNFFLLTAGLSIFGTHYFALLGSSKLQKWDPTYKSAEKAIEDDLNGDCVTQTMYDPDIIVRDSRSNTIVSEFPPNLNQN